MLKTHMKTFGCTLNKKESRDITNRLKIVQEISLKNNLDETKVVFINEKIKHDNVVGRTNEYK